MRNQQFNALHELEALAICQLSVNRLDVGCMPYEELLIPSASNLSQLDSVLVYKGTQHSDSGCMPLAHQPSYLYLGPAAIVSLLGLELRAENQWSWLFLPDGLEPWRWTIVNRIYYAQLGCWSGVSGMGE